MLYCTLGLTGSNQIIGIADTGLDVTNGYFYDANNTMPGPFHRKVIYYNSSYGDAYDLDAGHGTHVCGTAAGLAYEPYGDFARYSGVATGAKIAFFDIQNSNDPTLSDKDTVNPPPSYSDILEPLYAVGVRIFSKSWGSTGGGSSCSYGTAEATIDQFLWEHPECIVLNAAGNYGTAGLISPANYINGLTVGNSLNDGSAWLSLLGISNGAYTYNNLLGASSRGASCSSRVKPDLVAPGTIPLNCIHCTCCCSTTG